MKAEKLALALCEPAHIDHVVSFNSHPLKRGKVSDRRDYESA